MEGKSATGPSVIALVATGTASALALLYFLRDILIPLAMASVLAVLVNALVRSIGRRWPNEPRWAVSIIAGLVVIVSASAAIFALGRGGSDIVGQGPALLARVEQLVEQTGQTLGFDQPVHLATLTGQINVPQLAGRLAAGVQDIVSSVLLMVVYFGFIIGARHRIHLKVANIASAPETAGSINKALERIVTDIETYVWVQTVTGLLLAGISGIVMVSVGLDNALFWTIVLFLLSFIPILGVTVGSLAPALFALLQFPTLWQAAVVFGGIQIAAFVIGNFFYPRMQAETQNIDPVATLLALSLWGFLWGLAGAFLAVPLTLMLMMICAQFDSTRWIAVLLSDDGKPKFST
jgi:AI-2 transport protein TqsA